jgi:hypothetical protein
MTVILMTVLGGIHPGQALSASHLLSSRPHKLTPSHTLSPSHSYDRHSYDRPRRRPGPRMLQKAVLHRELSNNQNFCESSSLLDRQSSISNSLR